MCRLQLTDLAADSKNQSRLTHYCPPYTAIWRLFMGSAFLSYTKSTGEYDVAVIGTFFSLEFTEYLAPMCLYRVVTQVARKYLLTGKFWLDSVTHPL